MKRQACDLRLASSWTNLHICKTYLPRRAREPVVWRRDGKAYTAPRRAKPTRPP